MIDHRDLFKKYMQLVIDVEGYDFICECEMNWMSDVEFSEEELKELERIRDQAYKDGGYY